MSRMGSDMEGEIVRMLSGDMTVDEKHDFLIRCRADAELHASYETMKKLWEDCSRLEVANRINDRCEEEWLVFQKHCFGQGSQIKQSSRFVRYWQVAAVLIPLLLVGSLGLFFMPGMQELGWQSVATADQIDSVHLEDNSYVVLNKSSWLKYQLADKQRLVRLEGIAYFKVARDEERPFVVRLNHSEVRVLGTAFVIENIRDRNRVVVEVTDGRVKFDADHQSVILQKGEKAIFENGRIVKSCCDLSSVGDWMDGTLVFETATLEEVSQKLMQFYPEIKKINRFISSNDTVRITSRFENQPLSEVLEELIIHFNQKFNFSDGELTISD